MNYSKTGVLFRYSWLALLLGGQSLPAMAFDPQPLLKETTGIYQLMGLKDGTESVFALILETKDNHAVDVFGYKVYKEKEGLFRYENTFHSPERSSEPFWIQVTTSAVYIRHKYVVDYTGRSKFRMFSRGVNTATKEVVKSKEVGDIIIGTSFSTGTIRTPAGEFEALHVGYSANPASCETEGCDGCIICDEYWFSPGIGMVAYEDSSGGERLYLIKQSSERTLDRAGAQKKAEAFWESIPKRFENTPRLDRNRSDNVNTGDTDN